MRIGEYDRYRRWGLEDMIGIGDGDLRIGQA